MWWVKTLPGVVLHTKLHERLETGRSFVTYHTRRSGTLYE